jgi:hypothetical protein
MVGHLLDGHGGGPSEELGECAVMLRVEMLDQHKAKAGVERQLF